MKKLTYLLMAAAILACCLSCSKGKRGQRQGDGSEPSFSLKDNPLWTLSYAGRTFEVSPEDGRTYVIDVIRMDASDNAPYCISVLSREAFRTEYGSSLERFVEADSKTVEASYISEGSGSVSFDVLDAGGNEWVAVSYGITRAGDLTGTCSVLYFNTEAVSMKETSEWTAAYKGRSADGNIEKFRVDVSPSGSGQSWYASIVPEGQIANEYGGDLRLYLDGILDGIASGLAEGEDFDNVVFYASDDIECDRLASGRWQMYVYGVDVNGNLTGSYARYDFTVEQEAPTEAFSAWLGRWQARSDKSYVEVSGKDGYEYVLQDKVTEYELTVTSADANNLYYITGWEQGSYASAYANSEAAGYAILARFNRSTGDLEFINQYLGSIEAEMDNGQRGVFNIYFLGEYEDASDGLTVSFANTSVATAMLSGSNPGARVTGDKVPETVYSFCTMEFIDEYDAENPQDVYLQGYQTPVPAFPLQMTRLETGGQMPAPSLKGRALASPHIHGTDAVNTKALRETLPQDRVVRRSASGVQTVGKTVRNSSTAASLSPRIQPRSRVSAARRTYSSYMLPRRAGQKD